MNYRELTKKEEAVIDALIAQRKKHGDNSYFLYSTSDGVRYLIDADKAIDGDKQIEILHKLADDEIIDADWVVDINESEPKTNYDRYTFARGADWVESKFFNELDYMLLFNELTDEEMKERCFIHITFSDIDEVNEKCRKRFKATLFHDGGSGKEYFYVKCSNGKTYKIKNLRKGLLPYEVLLYAYKRPREVVIRDDLNNNGSNTKVGKQSIATRVYDDESPVRTALAPFVTLKAQSIFVEPNAELTQKQIDALEEASF